MEGFRMSRRRKHIPSHKETLITCLGRHPDDQYGMVNTPVYRASTILFPTLEAYDLGEKSYQTGMDDDAYPRSTYARYGTPSTKSLEETVAALEGAKHAIAFSSGVAAYTAVLLGLLKAGDHVLMVDSVYNPTRRLCEQELKRYGVEITYYDPLIGAGIAALLKPNTRVVFVESPGSLTFEVQDVPAISKAAHAKGAVVVADNTWLTPMHSRAFELGIDISVHSATKYISGHSDLIMGIVTMNDDYYPTILRAAHNTGACPGSDDAYLALRGLRSMAVRLSHQQKAAIQLAEWLKKRPEVTKVLHPAFPECPGHEIWKRDHGNFSCGLFSILLKPYPRPALAAMLDNLEHFGMGYSWGGYESLIIPFNPKPIRTANPWTYDGLCLRISVGLEHIDDLIEDLEKGFERLNKA